MKIVVTGGAGFVGSHVVERALREGHEVTIIDRVEHGPWIPSAAAYLQRDLAEGCPVLDGYDAVVHAAAYADISRNWDSKEERLQIYRDNIAASIHVLERVRDAQVPFVFVSSAAVIATNAPLSPYAASKDFIEKLAASYLEGVSSCWIVRLVSCVGKRYSHGHIADFVKLAKEKGHIVGKDTGLHPKSFVHVEDAASALLSCCSNLASHTSTMTVAAGSWSWRDTAAMMGVPALHFQVKDAGWRGDPVGLQVHSDWSCLRTVGEGVRETLVSLGWFK